MSQTAANAELTVTNLLWQKNDRMTAREIREQLYPNKMKAQHGAVERLSQRLEKKGLHNRDKSIAVHFFSDRFTRAICRASIRYFATLFLFGRPIKTSSPVSFSFFKKVV